MQALPKYFGYNPPFLPGPHSVMPRQVDERLIKNDLLQLLRTVPGERVYRPGFGCGLSLVVFDTLDAGGIDLLAQDIRQAIDENEDRVRVDNLDLDLADDGQSLDIRLEVSMVNKPLVKYLLEIRLGDGGDVALVNRA